MFWMWFKHFLELNHIAKKTTPVIITFLGEQWYLISNIFSNLFRNYNNINKNFPFYFIITHKIYTCSHKEAVLTLLATSGGEWIAPDAIHCPVHAPRLQPYHITPYPIIQMFMHTIRYSSPTSNNFTLLVDIQIKTRNITIPRGIVWRTGVLPPPLVIGAFTLDPAPCPRNHHPLIDIHFKSGIDISYTSVRDVSAVRCMSSVMLKTNF